MKVITIKQPWATLIAKGYKEYEFRTWKTKYRGEILIHAGKGIDKKAMARFENLKLEYPIGCIIAKAQITDCIPVDDDFRKKVVKKLSKGQTNDMFKQMEELFSKVDKLTKELKTQKKEIKVLNEKLTEKNNQIENLTDENKKLKTEIKRLKTHSKKDSSNSNKPSGTNGLQIEEKNLIKSREVKKDIKAIV